MIDNFDSFTYNIVHYVEMYIDNVKVRTNISVEKSDVDECTHLIISPGPGLPIESGKLKEMIESAVSKNKIILGVCLGMQALAEHFGGRLYNLPFPQHGRQKEVSIHTDSFIFKDLPEKINVGLYHSWAVSIENISEFKEIGISNEGVCMAIQHVDKPIFGVQFHPESILTEYGKKMIQNFLEVNV